MKQKLKCVLLIDDDDATNFLNKMVIESAGIAENIHTTLNGKEALEYLTNTDKFENGDVIYPQPYLIFLDINMPVMDGWEFMHEYQKLDEKQKKNKVIVMLTTSLNPDDKTKASLIHEINDFMSKPLLLESLKDLTEKYFPENIG